jgi:hypothetical protein
MRSLDSADGGRRSVEARRRRQAPSRRGDARAAGCGGMSDECPSCGGTSLSPTGDEGALVCDDCNEQFHGFRQEEMDDEDAGNFAVFARQSQEAKMESKRLNSAATDARAAMRAAAAADGVDYTRELYRGVVTISRAIVDALVAGGHAPDAIVDPCFRIVAHWIRMCHAGGRVKGCGVGATAHDFKAHCVLALVSLAAAFVRSSLLPRDLCALAAQNRIPFVTAASDLLPPEAMRNPRLWAAFTPHMKYSSADVCLIASALALSDLAWPPLRALFNGPRKLYLYREYSCFPVGQYRATVARLARELGLPDDFAARVERFRDLRQAATAMSRKTHRHYKETVAPRHYGPHAKAKRRRAESAAANPGAPPDGGDTAEDDDGADGGVDDGRGGGDADAHSYGLRSGVCELPFAPRTPRSKAMEEFPTSRTVLVDLLATVRLCYGRPAACPQGAARGEGAAERSQRAAEWAACVAAMRRWMADGGADADTVLWAGLSPAALSTLRGKPLRSFAAEARASTDGSAPIFLTDASDAFRSVERAAEGREGERAESGQEAVDAAGGEGERGGESIALRRVANWVWESGGECASAATRAALDPRSTCIDAQAGTSRGPLMRRRGFVSKALLRRSASRSLHWWPLGPGEAAVWDEPAAVGWIASIAMCFFRGTPAFVAGSCTEDRLHAASLARCCDEALSTVFNYVDVYLGEEGTLAGPPGDADAAAADPYVRSLQYSRYRR